MLLVQGNARSMLFTCLILIVSELCGTSEAGACIINVQVNPCSWLSQIILSPGFKTSWWQQSQHCKAQETSASLATVCISRTSTDECRHAMASASTHKLCMQGCLLARADHTTLPSSINQSLLRRSTYFSQDSTPELSLLGLTQKRANMLHKEQ